MKMFSEAIGVLHYRGILELPHSCWRSRYIASQVCNTPTGTKLYPKNAFGYERVTFGYEKWHLQTQKRLLESL